MVVTLVSFYFSCARAYMREQGDKIGLKQEKDGNFSKCRGKKHLKRVISHKFDTKI